MIMQNFAKSTFENFFFTGWRELNVKISDFLLNAHQQPEKITKQIPHSLVFTDVLLIKVIGHKY